MQRRLLTRRRALAGLAGGLGFVMGGTTRRGAGATARGADDASGSSGPADSRSGSRPAQPALTRVSDADLPVPRSDLVRGAGRDAIPAIVDPAFAPDWSGVEVEVENEFGRYTATLDLTDAESVVGVVRDGRARAYPLRVLSWHEVVNDTFDGPVLVTYCPLCGSGMVARRTVRGTATTFGVTGLLWRDNLVLYDDATGSLWSQLAATAIRGPLVGTELELLPSELTSWGAWREAHPETSVLLPPPHSDTVVEGGTRDYTLDPYGAYETNDRIGFGPGGFASVGPSREFADDRLDPKAAVLGVAVGGHARAYPLSAVTAAGAVNDAVGGLPVVVAATAGGSMVAYDRRVDGRARTFDRADGDHLTAAGSRWALRTGRAVDGPHRGTTLDRLSGATRAFWFAWLAFHPDTSVYGVDG